MLLLLLGKISNLRYCIKLKKKITILRSLVLYLFFTMVDKINSKDKKKTGSKIRKNLTKVSKIRSAMCKLLRSLKPRKKEELPPEVVETCLTQMLSASTNDLLNLDATMTGARLLTPRAQRLVLGL